jgi:hypothetical protein
MRKSITGYSSAMGDRRDCSVRALAVACDLPYKDAHSIFEKAGRIAGHGTSVCVSSRVHLDLGFTKLDPASLVVDAKFPKYANHRVNTSVAKFAREHRLGTYILHTKTHALALVRGVVHDWSRGAGSHGRIVRAWQVK